MQNLKNFMKILKKFSIGICNGCQLMAELGWIDCKMLENTSQRFESRWTSVKVNKTNNIFLKHLEGVTFGMWVAHKEGRFSYDHDDDYVPALQYVDTENKPTQQYPYNPNGSVLATAAVSSKNGRHLAIMPHPERSFLSYQVPYDEGLLKNKIYSPWFSMFAGLDI